MPSTYDPATLRITGASTVYEEFHEFAHLEQDMRHTVAWRFRKAFTRCPALRYTGLAGLAQLACELEAAFLARGELLRCNLWGDAERREAVDGLLSYVRHTFLRW